MADEELRISPARQTFDLATVVGILGAFALIAIAISLEGSPTAFINTTAIIIVLGGTFAATLVCFSFGEMAQTVGVLSKTLFHSSREPREAALHVLQISYLARRHGILSLQAVIDQMRGEAFLFKGIAMIVDGIPGAEVDRLLRRDIEAMIVRHQKSVNVLRRAAEFAPAMVLIGTLIGLVQMLGGLDDPTTIGPRMAVALLTTFYGALLANLVYTPLAAKLERNSVMEETINNIYLIGVASVGRQENPRRLEMLLNSILPPSDRVRFFE